MKLIVVLWGLKKVKNVWIKLSMIYKPIGLLKHINHYQLNQIVRVLKKKAWIQILSKVLKISQKLGIVSNEKVKVSNIRNY